MFPKASILYSCQLKIVDKNLKKLLDFMGLECDVFSVEQFMTNKKELLNKKNLCLLASSETMNDVIRVFKETDNSVIDLMNKLHSMLIYALAPSQSSYEVIKLLTEGVVSSVSQFEHNNYQYKVSDKFKDICGPFSGLSFGPINRDIDFGINVRGDVVFMEPLISIGERAFFIKIKKDNCNLFIVASKDILDIEQKISGNLDVKKCFSQLVPILMYLKSTFIGLCWHSDNNYASFIFDDPLLRPSYGFLNYEKLLQLMNNYYFSTNIAFIPWNFRRTSRQVSRIFLKRPDKFTISIHGCDHSGSEFGSEDFVELNSRVKRAKKWMQLHQRTTGIKFDNVMVFPQGIFSTHAMRILKCNNFLAAVNTDVVSHGSKTGEIEISQLLDMAITKYESFPLFTRRYPNEVVDLAFDMFMGKPLFIVEHHDYLKEGYARMASFIESINLLDENIIWDGLENIIRKSYLERSSLNGKIYVKIFTNNCEIKNTSNNFNKYIVTKKECSNVSISSVMIDGKSVPYNLEGQLVTLSIEIPPNNVVNLKIDYRDSYSGFVGKNTIKTSIKAYFRRYLSEFRDNYISKNDFLLSIVNKVKKFT